MNKCLGCGTILQHDNPNLEGFVSKEGMDYCERCFRIKNYGDYKSIVKDNNTFINILKDINKTNSLVLLVVDIFNLPENFDIIVNNINNPILLVLTKRDLLPKSIYDDRLLEYMDNYNLNLLDKIIVSSSNNYQMDELINKIKTYKTDNNVYVVGYTNAGKSSLINKLIYNYSNNLPTITTSMLPSTTLNNIEIQFDDNLTLIDTPGILEENSIDNFIDIKTLKMITPKSTIKPITYQIKSKQFIVIDNLVKLGLKDNNITIFGSNTLKIDRYFKDKELELEKKQIEVDSNTDLVISGLGFIKFTKKEIIEISVLKGVKVYTRKSFI